MRRRGIAFALVAGACLVVGVAAVGWAVAQERSRADDRDVSPGGSARVRVDALAKPLVVFQHVVRDEGYAHVAVTAATRAPVRRTLTPLVCERVYFAGGRGLCLLPKRGLGFRFTAKIVASDFRVVRELSLSGRLSRARISPDGRFGATTGFVAGHSYAEHGAFSTQTMLIDLIQGRAIANLEEFEATEDGRRVDAIDRNFWGVTFAGDGNRFYATMSTRRRTYLVEGEIRERRLRVLHENVECPSLSPDETRVAYKKRLGDGEWRLHVLDLATMAETPLAEPRSIDDQVEWLDDRRILYGTPEGDVWVVRADGTGTPARYLAGALSPAVVRAY